MRNVEWLSRQGPVCHPIYEREEADGLGIEYLSDPRSVREQGQWILTDDGRVVQVLKYGRSATGKRWIRTCTGTFPIDEKVAVDTATRPSRYTMGGTKRLESHQRHQAEWDIFAEMVAAGKNICEAYRIAYPDATCDRYIKEKALKLMQKAEVKKIVARKLDDVLTAQGVTPEYLIGRYKELADNADADSVSLASLNSLAKISGILDQGKKEHTAPVFLGLPQQLLDTVRESVTVPVQAQVVPGEDDFGEADVVGEDEAINLGE